ncbi:MAG: hypothetical protein COT71_00585 [Candidatus Andersenbacteria bacterium CG10_big_fil_rev_8_21_14_0_10_54_11]|uniref:Uncharacterized protein n=1 Tax=Candidatus Andersenbacteria bacterium CG10_big_fil_rev_8_21_14_0_10_54_11 TaxID=1974485 RepID=A0A2M6X0C1_9BACT|nr:MAG: hypothetical protein COT71_00585 [Candidatus Andersenbacteria bacterium CG10_big_fil_rev_8_21_14_0_10_54_11]
MGRLNVRLLQLFGGGAGLFMLVWGSIWLLLLTSATPLESPLADWPLFPIACSTRGCVTSARWQQQQSIQAQFAHTAGEQAPLPAASLTTVVRQHLVHHASVRVPATMGDARRYREEVLQAKDPEQIERATGLTIPQYDKLVVLPLLQQEAVRLERSADNYEILFADLAKDRPIVILAWPYRWDGETGSVAVR